MKWFDISKLEMDEKLMAQYELLISAQLNNQIGYCSWTFYPSEMRVYMNENTDSMFLDMLTVEDYLATSQTYIDAAIEDGTIPVLP